MDWQASEIVSVILSTAAFIVAVYEAHRGNAVVIALEECSYIFRGSRDENDWKPFPELSIRIRNFGVSLHDVALAIHFADPNYRGWITVPIPTKTGKLQSHGEFSRGMIAQFQLKGYLLNEPERRLLAELLDPKKQLARLIVFSQDKDARRFRVSRWSDGLKWLWNRFTWKANRFLRREFDPGDGGEKMVNSRWTLRQFKIPSEELAKLVKAIRRDLPPAPVPPQTPA